MTTDFSIGALAERTGCNVQTIRWYEQTGLLPPAGRSAGNQRRYGPAHLRRLAFVRHARELGFPLDAIRELLALVDHPAATCAAVHAIAAGHRAAVRSRIARLQALDRELGRMVDECAAGRIGACRVIEVLADHTHAHCLADGHGSGPALGEERG
ncbi:MAG: helix-turn-helix domain-containing protein [Alphaproteobacteria bacterium]|nr:helix-turn-helix domain-containing protein [Alphaproteobacteria bacterium]